MPTRSNLELTLKLTITLDQQLQFLATAIDWRLHWHTDF